MSIKKKNIWIILLIIFIIFAGFILIKNNEMSKYKSEYDKYNNYLEELVLKDDFFGIDNDYINIRNTYIDTLDDFHKSIADKNKNKCDEYITELSNLKKIIIEKNHLIISDMKEEVDEIISNKNLFQYELKEIKKNKKIINKFIEEEKFISAYNEYFSILNYVLKISDHEIDFIQYDYSQFPKVKVYFDANKLEDIINESLNNTKFKIVEKIGNDFKELNIDSQGTIKESGNLNIDLVADISGSMTDFIGDVKLATNNFAENIGMNKNKVGLISFADFINRESDFTNEKSAIQSKINNLHPDGMTCLYDALCVSISNISLQNGPKCIVAFTDGLDNRSFNNYSTVINLAEKYKVPIYIIGIGIQDYTYEKTLKKIATQTGGYYSNISNSNINNEMSNIYNNILNKQQSVYYLEYTDKNTNKSEKRDIYVEYEIDNLKIRGKLNDSIEDSHQIISDDVRKSEVASFVRESNIKYFDAMNERNENIVIDYYDASSDKGKQLIKEMKYNLKINKEKDYYYEFFDYSIDKVEIIDGTTWDVTFSQNFVKKSASGEILTYTSSSAIDRVIERNGRFYIGGFKSISGNTTKYNNQTNQLID